MREVLPVGGFYEISGLGSSLLLLARFSHDIIFLLTSLTFHSSR